ncbi:Protein of unknown function, partial [Gryllus bimaculatus]
MYQHSDDSKIFNTEMSRRSRVSPIRPELSAAEAKDPPPSERLHAVRQRVAEEAGHAISQREQQGHQRT